MAITAVNDTTLLPTLMSIEHGSGEKTWRHGNIPSVLGNRRKTIG
jgi:hypothetical protein